MDVSLIVTIIVIAILVCFLIRGVLKGFLYVALSTASLVVTLIIAGLLVPWFSGVIESSFIGKGVESQISAYLDQNLNDPLVNSVGSIQESVIGNLPLPQNMREDISEKNTTDEYVELQVGSFTEYLKVRLVKIANRVIAYVILSILLFILIRILLSFSKAIRKIPIVGGINAFFGGVVGLLEGLLILWCLCLLIMMFSGTSFGVKAVEVINGSKFLKFIYDNNGILLAAQFLFRSML